MTGIALVLSFVVPYGLALLILFFVIKAAVSAALENNIERIHEVLHRKDNNSTDANDVIKLY